MPASLGYIRAGKLRALAVTTAKRQEPLPDVPTVGEFLPGFEARGWYGIVVPKDTPPEIVEKLNKEINAALTDPNMKKRLTDLGAAVFAGSSATSESSSPTKSRSGARWSGLPASRRNNHLVHGLLPDRHVGGDERRHDGRIAVDEIGVGAPTALRSTATTASGCGLRLHSTAVIGKP
jgi:hypothetical protein